MLKLFFTICLVLVGAILCDDLDPLDGISIANVFGEFRQVYSNDHIYTIDHIENSIVQREVFDVLVAGAFLDVNTKSEKFDKINGFDVMASDDHLIFAHNVDKNTIDYYVYRADNFPHVVCEGSIKKDGDVEIVAVGIKSRLNFGFAAVIFYSNGGKLHSITFDGANYEENESGAISEKIQIFPTEVSFVISNGQTVSKIEYFEQEEPEPEPTPDPEPEPTTDPEPEKIEVGDIGDFRLISAAGQTIATVDGDATKIKLFSLDFDLVSSVDTTDTPLVIYYNKDFIFHQIGDLVMVDYVNGDTTEKLSPLRFLNISAEIVFTGEYIFLRRSSRLSIFNYSMLFLNRTSVENVEFVKFCQLASHADACIGVECQKGHPRCEDEKESPFNKLVYSYELLFQIQRTIRESTPLVRDNFTLFYACINSDKEINVGKDCFPRVSNNDQEKVTLGKNSPKAHITLRSNNLMCGAVTLAVPSMKEDSKIVFRPISALESPKINFIANDSISVEFHFGIEEERRQGVFLSSGIEISSVEKVDSLHVCFTQCPAYFFGKSSRRVFVGATEDMKEIFDDRLERAWTFSDIAPNSMCVRIKGSARPQKYFLVRELHENMYEKEDEKETYKIYVGAFCGAILLVALIGASAMIIYKIRAVRKDRRR